ncbi:hypothetical protein SISNIDRAFT_469857 [Sistotremastrum niveocremeum HHB9708]|uniref:Uncharacterized protein n=1 Tax=Sistotremastrum niveocremeum HHB9708 TaxID=1314777 RepID=A0A164PJ62_9AGAM|nr:hypothetical protein SISNIDRAFT_469857 [Sistotremastrum niveocremeum HHB9708]
MRANLGDDSPDSSTTRSTKPSRKSHDQPLRSIGDRSEPRSRLHGSGKGFATNALGLSSSRPQTPAYRNEIDRPNSDLLIAIYSMDQPDWVSSKSYVELAKLSFEILDDPPEAPDLRQKIFDLSSQITRPGARSMHFEEKRQLFKDAYHTCMTYAEIMDRMPHHKLSVTPKSPDRLRIPLATETAGQKKASSEVQSVTSAVATNIRRSQSPIGTQQSTPSPRSQTSTPQVEQTARSVFFPRFASVNPQLPQIKVEEGQLPTPVNHGLDATVFPIASPKTDHRGILPSSVGPRLSGIRATSQGPQTRTANTSRTVTNNAYHVPLVSELSTILPVTRFARPGEGGYTHPSQRGYIRNDVQYNYPAELLNNTANGYEPSQGDKPTPMTDAPLWNEDTDDLPRPVRIIRRAWNRNHSVFPQKSALATVGIKLESTHQYSGDDDPEKFVEFQSPVTTGLFPKFPVTGNCDRLPNSKMAVTGNCNCSCARDCPTAEKPNPSIKSLSVRIAEPEAGDDETADQNADQPSDTEQQDDGQYILSLSEEEYQRAIYEDDSDEFAAEEE